MLLWIYAMYVAISLAITVWVGKTLHSNGRVFLVENFKGNETLADSVNHLLLVCFYLINLGYITFTLKYGDKPFDLIQGAEFLSTKVGGAVIVLGAMHFFNMYALMKMRNFKSLQTAAA